MNFLLRPAQTAAVAAAEQPSVSSGNLNTLEGLISEDPHSSSGDEHSEDFNKNGSDNGSATLGSNAKPDAPIVENYIEVAEEEGWITIPYKEIPDDWSEASDILALRSLDRSFVFPGEQVHILACLSAYKQDTEIITPFKVAAMMTKNGIGRKNKKQNGDLGSEADSVSESVEVSPGSQDGENPLKEVIDQKKDISAGESLLRMEDHRRQTQSLLRRFENSHFFVRISESDEPLWSRRSSAEYSETAAVTFDSAEARKTTKSRDSLNAIIDRGKFDASVSGGLARNSVKCCSLPNGDIVVLLQVNIGISSVRNPVLEIFQFEKHGSRNLTDETTSNAVNANQDPCGELLKWLLPLDNSVPPPSRPLSPPKLSSSSSIRSTSAKVNFSASSGSQLFSFGHLRSYSMSSLPPNITPPQPVTPTSKPNVDLEDWDKLASQKLVKSSKVGSQRLLSFRGVSLEPDRFSVRCGLEGIYIPGRRWRRKIEIIQPIEIHSFAADCNTDDLLCVQIKNVSPAHVPDIVVYLDAITIVYEEVSNGGVPSSLPIACIESGTGHMLPNLALRRGEEHSFILKPATSIWKATRGSQSSHLLAGSSPGLTPRFVEVKRNALAADQFAVMVSCRCNYTESKLFFKQPTSWKPRISRDLMISVASEVSRQNVSLNDRVAQLPVQVLTLQASNLTSEDLTLTVLAPASFTSPPSVVSLNSSPSSPTGRSAGHFESEGSGRSKKTAVHKLSSPTFPSENQRYVRKEGQRSVSLNEKAISGVLPSTDLGCTHLWLQSRVPLGCVPSQSTANIKLELLPLTDGIITLDSLQIEVKEKGMTYIPEHSLKINATSSIATGVVV